MELLDIEISLNDDSIKSEFVIPANAGIH